MPLLLVVDDEPSIRYSLEKGLRSESLEVVAVATARAALDAVVKKSPDAVIMDVRLPDLSGLNAIEQIRREDPRLPIIVVTAHGSAETAIQAMSLGAIDYFLKPLDLQQLREAVRHAVDVSRMRRVPAVFEQESRPTSGQVDRIIGASPAMHEVYKSVGRIAPHDATALILGESGTGKEVIARAIYQHSARKDGPFLALNCAAIPENLLESELFGHEKGAFTGADRRRIGKFEQAHGGTLFLDEIGDLSPATQAKLLRVLQEQQFERIGGNETIQTDVRIIAATNQNLESKVAQGTFRGDLFFRINGFTIHLPPLRDRRSDIPALTKYFVERFGTELGMSGMDMTPEAIEALERHDWPGNVRELQSAVRFAMLHAPAHVIDAASLPPNVRRIEATRSEDARNVREASPRFDLESLIARLLQEKNQGIYHTICDAVDRVVLLHVLKHVGNNQVAASETLGISRTTLRQKMRHLQLSFDTQVTDFSQSE